MPKKRSTPSRRPVNTLTMVLLSDTHGLHRELTMPDADILIHSGDLCMMGDRSAMRDFDCWLGELGYRHRIVVPGNHDVPLLDPIERSHLLCNATVLVNEYIEIDGLRIWGSPITPYSGGAFCVRSAEERRRIYASIPDDVDVLVTHGPPLGILDGDYHGGDSELLVAVQRIKPRLHMFGHIHAGHGLVTIGETTYVNASMLTDFGDIDQQPVVLRMAKE